MPDDARGAGHEQHVAFVIGPAPQRCARKTRRTRAVLLRIPVGAGLARILDRLGRCFRRQAIQHQRAAEAAERARRRRTGMRRPFRFFVRFEALQIEPPVTLEPAVIDVDIRNRIPYPQQMRVTSCLQRIEQRAVRDVRGGSQRVIAWTRYGSRHRRKQNLAVVPTMRRADRFIARFVAPVPQLDYRLIAVDDVFEQVRLRQM